MYKFMFPTLASSNFDMRQLSVKKLQKYFDRAFNCVLCGHLSEGLDKYVLHLVSHDLLFNNNNTSSSNSSGPSQPNTFLLSSINSFNGTSTTTTTGTNTIIKLIY